MGVELDLISMLGQNELDACLGDQNSLGFRMGGLGWLDCSVKDRT